MEKTTHSVANVMLLARMFCVKCRLPLLNRILLALTLHLDLTSLSAPLLHRC